MFLKTSLWKPLLSLCSPCPCPKLLSGGACLKPVTMQAASLGTHVQ